MCILQLGLLCWPVLSGAELHRAAFGFVTICPGHFEFNATISIACHLMQAI